jgi:hypothetical protein
MRIENKSGGQVSYSIIGDTHVLDFGTTKVGEPLDANINVKGNDIRQVLVSVTCGCTVANPTYVDNETFNIDIRYSNDSVGTFGKMLYINYYEDGDGIQKSAELKIKGKTV